MKHKIPSADYLNECFRYDPLTGDLFWRERPKCHFVRGFSWKRWNLTHAKTKVTGMSGGRKLYYRVSVNKVSFLAHRIIFKMFYGIDADCIDHIDGNGLNNKINNLRNVSQLDNCRNRKMPSNNTSGITGVSWNKSRELWAANISIKGKTKFIGWFRNINDAQTAYEKEKIKQGFHINHGLNINH